MQDIVDASPYRDVKDSPQVTHTFEMVQAKLAGYVLPVNEVLSRYPVTDTSEVARYARAMAYMRKPDLAKALTEINSLIQDEPNNPFFYEVLGQIHVSMAHPELGIPAYQKSVDLRPGAPQLRLGLATAQLATDNVAMAPAALQNLKAASLAENDDVFTWYETAQAYSLMKNEPMADLSTAEAYYNGGSMKQAVVFASRARRDLTQGTPDWQRANDIVGAAASQAASKDRRKRTRRMKNDMRDLIVALAGAVGGALIAIAVVFAAANTGMLPNTAGGAGIRAYLLSHPELVAEMTDRLQAKQQADSDRASADAIKKLGLAPFFDTKIAFVTGPADAKKTLVEFYDYDCPYCRASLPAMKNFYAAHKNDTRFSFIELPIPTLHGPTAVLAARASLAARLQPDKYIPFHFALLGETGNEDESVIYADAQKVGLDVAKLKADMANPDIDKAIAASHALADSAKIDGTPTFIVNGVMHPGAVDDDTLAGLAKES